MTGRLPQPTPSETSQEPPVLIPITGELDLHTFAPKDLGTLIPAYLAECQSRGIYTVRIIHGKGTGTLRTTVHTLLRRSPLVRSFEQAGEHSGSWGATIATLHTQLLPITPNPLAMS